MEVNSRKKQIVSMTAGGLLILLSPFIGYAQYRIGRAVARIVILRHFEKSPPASLDVYALGEYVYVNLSVIAVVFVCVVMGIVAAVKSMPGSGGAGAGISK